MTKQNKIHQSLKLLSKQPINNEEMENVKSRIWASIQSELKEGRQMKNIFHSIDFKLYAPALAVMLLLLGVISNYYVYKPAEVAINQDTSKSIASSGSALSSVNPTISPSNISTSTPMSVTATTPTQVNNLTEVESTLLKRSDNKNGYSLGYIKQTKTVSRWNIIGRAFASADTYHPVIYYSKKKGAENPQIFRYDFVDKKEYQITNDSYYNYNPVVSTIAQRFTYSQCSNTPAQEQNCKLLILDANNNFVFKEVYNKSISNVAYWSPNGEKIAYVEPGESIYIDYDNGGRGGRTFNKIVIFNLTTDSYISPSQPAKTVIYPQSWTDDTSLLVRDIALKNVVSIYSLNISRNTYNKIETKYPNPTSVETSSGYYVYKTTPTVSSEVNTELAIEKISDNTNSRIISKTYGAYDFLVGQSSPQDINNILVDLVASSGNFSSEGYINVGLTLLDLKNNSQKKLNTNKDGVRFLGWLSNYNNAIYYDNPGSGATKSNIHVINVHTGEDSIEFTVDGVIL